MPAGSRACLMARKAATSASERERWSQRFFASTRGRIVNLLVADFTMLLPLVRWINGVLGLRAAQRR